MKKVLHIVRKNTQLKASFIQNQIINHSYFEPHVLYYEDRQNNIDGGFAGALPNNIGVQELNTKKGSINYYLYKTLKILGNKPSKEFLIKTKQLDVDIIHLHYGTDAGIFLKSLRKLDIPKVVSFYGYECSGFPKRFFGLGKYYLKYRTFKYADKIFAMSEDMKKDLLALGCPENKIIVHYYGTDVQKFIATHVYQNVDIINFLIISGLAPQKGHLFLLQAFEKAYQINNKISLSIIGEGAEKEKILNFIQSHNMNIYVKLLPFVVYGSDEHKGYFTNSDIFIHPSVTDVNGDKEGIPGAIVEAMAAGLPVIATHHAGIPYIIENEKTGLLVKEHDIDALANAILKLADSNKLRETIGRAGQEYVRINLDLFKKEVELEEIYSELINTKN